MKEASKQPRIDKAKFWEKHKPTNMHWDTLHPLPPVFPNGGMALILPVFRSGFWGKLSSETLSPCVQNLLPERPIKWRKKPVRGIPTACDFWICHRGHTPSCYHTLFIQAAFHLLWKCEKMIFSLLYALFLNVKVASYCKLCRLLWYEIKPHTVVLSSKKLHYTWIYTQTLY